MKTLPTNSFKLIILSSFLMVMATISVYAQSSLSALQKQLASQVDQNQVASDKVKAFIKAKLIPQVSNSAIVVAVQAQNAKNISLDEIKMIDSQWIEAEDKLPIHQQMMSGACADEVKNLTAQLQAVGETFVMDNQGANVCQNSLTSDYWQGDEAKWKNSYNSGAGGIEIGAEKLDRSTRLVLQQVSLPVADKNGKVIGAVCYGVITDRL